MDKTFTFSAPDAINIGYIVQRHQNDPQFLHKVLIRALNLESVQRAGKHQKGREGVGGILL